MRILIILKKQILNRFFFVNFSKLDVSMQSLNLLVMNFDFDFFFHFAKDIHKS